ncbi:MAG: AAA domain-containing protein [Alphaproteobacteria bacterium]
MKRTFIQHGIVQLEKLFAEKGEERATMRSLLDELEHRKTDRAKRLRSRVEERLTAIENQSREGPAPTGHLFEGQPVGVRPENRPVPSRTSSDPAASFASASQRPAEVSTPSIPDEQPDDRRIPQHFTGIAAPGVRGKPDAYQPALDTDLVIDLPQDSTNIQRYVLALDALISEMRREGSGSRRYELERGKVVDTQAGQPIYVFPFSEEAEIFEEARIEIEVDGRRSRGQIVSISEGTILISLDGNLGPSIRRCILLIDNTALIEALKDRLDQVGKGELNLSASVADSVVSKEIHNSEVSPIGVPPHDLNDSQNAALHLMLEHSISYLWGPPGTGKTQTLSVGIQAAFDAGKRILVCSNTNQAVDQLIYKLCRHLEHLKHAAFEEGKVVRIGNIVLPELKNEYASYVTTDGIIERLSKGLRERQHELEEQVALFDAKATSINEKLQLFARLDRTESKLTSLNQQLNTCLNAIKTAAASYEKAQQQIQDCKAELQQRKSAGVLRRVFLRSDEIIISDYRRAESEIARQEAIVRNGTAEAKTLENKRNEVRSSAESLASQLSVQDRQQLERDRQAIDGERQPLVAELQEIARRLAEMEASIMREARVIGTTVAKSYLQARDIGRFDVVVIDEASMVLLPALYFAAGLSTERVIVSGDFRQLPPILPSRQQAIHDLIGQDVFESAGIDGKSEDPRYALLDTQYRMTDEICGLIATDMYQGRLTTAKERHRPNGPRPPAPYDGALTIIDTSRLWPFESRNIFKSRFNLLNALLIRNLVGYLASNGFLDSSSALGVCTPYAAQAKLLQKLIGDMEPVAQLAATGTVHRYQGDEKRMMILDIPESIGPSRRIGLFVQGIPPKHVGARLMNVAVSRAQEHLLVLANLTYLDMHLPSTALLRGILHTAQEHGRVIDASEVMALRPIERDLKDLMGIVELDLDAEKLGLFHSKTFADACLVDMNRAERSIVMYSGFITPERVASYGDLFRTKIGDGVAIRCVTRPPRFNGSIPEELGKQALDALEGIGVVVDCRRDIHEKIVLIDNRVIWSGSLNPLSHTSRTDEFMTRAESEGFAEQVAAFVSKRIGIARAEAASTVAEAENPRCPNCNSRTYYAEGRYGPYFTCEDEEGCGWHDSARGTSGRKSSPSDPSLQKDGPPCPECGGPTKLRNGRFGPFYGCADYPKCKGAVNLGGKKKRGKAGGASRRWVATTKKRSEEA